MNNNQKTIARNYFKLKVMKADGCAFEDIFTQIMNYKEPDFQQVKPWGNIGDRKNDGYVKQSGIFYQVFAPENIKKSYPEIVQKMTKDFEGLLKNWDIKEFYFVVNDKFKGVHADSEKYLEEIRQKYNLSKARFITPKDLENWLFDLEDDQIMSIVGFLPNPDDINLDFSILNEVIAHIMNLNLPTENYDNIAVPDWNEKIKFNNLSDYVKTVLDSAFLSVHSLDKYLGNEGNSCADLLKDKLQEVYIIEKSNLDNGDDLFWNIVNKTSPRNQKMYMDAVLVIMAKYFESCDIFEKPE